mmetsp:Transcript_11870/g.47711  ORF Transcript_11870/g.47711 Transcript_11870/m.47711 type:complete len:332 (+) Transcript_11870:1211-2206(+)
MSPSTSRAGGGRAPSLAAGGTDRLAPLSFPPRWCLYIGANRRSSRCYHRTHAYVTYVVDALLIRPIGRVQVQQTKGPPRIRSRSRFERPRVDTRAVQKPILVHGVHHGQLILQVLQQRHRGVRVLRARVVLVHVVVQDGLQLPGDNLDARRLVSSRRHRRLAPQTPYERADHVVRSVLALQLDHVDKLEPPPDEPLVARHRDRPRSHHRRERGGEVRKSQTVGGREGGGVGDGEVRARERRRRGRDVPAPLALTRRVDDVRLLGIHVLRDDGGESAPREVGVGVDGRQHALLHHAGFLEPRDRGGGEAREGLGRLDAAHGPPRPHRRGGEH